MGAIIVNLLKRMKMHRAVYVFAFFAVLSACTDGDQESHGDVKYKTYHNQFYDYKVEYPDFLIPQGEATNRDGQKFISEDQAIELLVYRDYKNNYLAGGDLYRVDEAYKEALRSVQGVFNKKLEKNAYIIEYKEDDLLHTDYAQLYADNYFNIRFIYSEKDQHMLQGTIKHVIKSLSLDVVDGRTQEQEGNALAGSLADTFPTFIEGFLSDVYWGKNFNNLLRSNDKILATYIDSRMDVRRYYAPGTVSVLASRAEDFGFAQEDDFLSQAKTGGAGVFELIGSDVSPCELDFNKNQSVYYQRLQSLPSVVINMETFEMKSVRVIYPQAPIMAVYLPNAYGNPRGFYFIDTPDGWKLAFVDDSLCGA